MIGGSRLWSWNYTHGPQPTQRPHVQENEAGTITNLQLRSGRPDGRTYTAEMPTSADNKNKCVANGSPVTHQTLRQKGGTGEDGYTHLADWTLSVAAIEKKKKGWSSKPRLFPHTLTIGPPCHHGHRTTMLTGGMSDDPSITFF